MWSKFGTRVKFLKKMVFEFRALKERSITWNFKWWFSMVLLIWVKYVCTVYMYICMYVCMYVYRVFFFMDGHTVLVIFWWPLCLDHFIILITKTKSFQFIILIKYFMYVAVLIKMLPYRITHISYLNLAQPKLNW